MASSRARFEPAPDSPIKANFAALEAIGEAMIDSGYTVMSVQSSLEDIARANGYPKTEIVVMPTALFVSVRGSGEVHTGVVSSGGRPLQLHQLDELDDIVLRARSGTISADQARALVLLLRQLPSPYPAALRVLAYIPLCAALSVLLGASWMGVAVASALGAIVGIVLYFSSNLPSSRVPLVTLGLAFGCAAAVFTLVRYDYDPGVLPSLIAPIVVLLPGALLTTGVLELSSGQMVSGASRLAGGAMQLVLLAGGIATAGALVGVPHIEFAAAYQPLGSLGPWLAVLVFGASVVINRGGRLRTIGWVIVILYVAYTAQGVSEQFLGAVPSAFIGALLMTPVALLAARSRSGPAAPVVFLPGFWMLVPGSLGLVGTTSLLAGDDTGLSTLVTTVSTMVAIAIGVLLGSALTARTRTPL